MISVYRIYLGRSWVASGDAAALCSLFDQLPEFLHGMHSLPLDTPDAASLTAAERHAAVRITMTQAHVVILRAGDDEPPNAWTTEEIVTARTGFRHRIPILAVLPPGHDATTHPHARMADKTVAWNNVEIARGVQELAEAAAAERRVMVERSGRRNECSGEHQDPAERALPMEQIAEAYRLYTGARLSRTQRTVAPPTPDRK